MMDQRASSYGTGDDDLSSVLINQNNNISASTQPTNQSNVNITKIIQILIYQLELRSIKDI